ncbi:MAG: MerR family transcriptional regulator [Candidatus Neomarinimicrobiota bacterium]|nr:MAG: MerR family transcriptional regulator [Candidatus Neomarinimicrobiota bacterium]
MRLSMYLIGDLASKTGLSLHTLNYYLRIGLIEEVGRSETNNYRFFDDSTVDLLNRIIALRLQRVPIQEIKWRKENGIL